MPTYVEAPPGGGGPMIAVDTNPEAFERDGILMGAGMGRAPRRNPFRIAFGGASSHSTQPMPSFGGSESQQSMGNVPVRVNKME